MAKGRGVLAGAGNGVAGRGHQGNGQKTGDRDCLATNVFAHNRFILYLAPANASGSDE
jgi:hypothetical protein